jgi:hypothetical protein
MTSTTGKLVEGPARMLRSVVVVALAAAATLGTANVANAAAAREIAEFRIENSPCLPVATGGKAWSH